MNFTYFFSACRKPMRSSPSGDDPRKSFLSFTKVPLKIWLDLVELPPIAARMASENFRGSELLFPLMQGCWVLVILHNDMTQADAAGMSAGPAGDTNDRLYCEMVVL